MRQGELRPLIVSAPEAAALLAISERTLWSLTAPRGPIPVVRMTDRSVRYAVTDLEAYIHSRRVA